MKFKIMLLLIMVMLVFTACSNGDTADINVTALKGPTGMGMAKLMNDAEEGRTANNYNFNLSSAPDEVTAEVIKGTVDIAAVPINLAGVLYAKTEGNIKIAAVNTLGVLYILENGDTVNEISDLAGKTIYATGQGSTPEYILKYLLTANGIDPDNDVEIIFKTEHSELAALMAAGEAVIGMLPEPNVTAVLNQTENVRIALDLTAEWSKISDDSLIQGCIIVNKEFAENNKTAVNKFLEEYKKSVDFVNSNVDEASVLIAKYEIVPSEGVAKKSLPNCNIVYIDGDEMKQNVNSVYKIFFDANPASIGGEIPDEEIFYNP